MPHNLTGMHHYNKTTLTGTCENKVKPSYKINQLKKYILTNYIIPLYSEQWDIINNNKLLIDATIIQINNYYKLYKLEELNLFLELLHILKLLFIKNELLIDLEDKTKKTYNKNNIINMVYKTTRIQLLPEYEIYNSILGKPTNKTPYNVDIINDIKMLLSRPSITYDKINEHIEKMSKQ